MFEEASHSGLVRSLGKRIYRKVSEVQILSPPPKQFIIGVTHVVIFSSVYERNYFKKSFYYPRNY